MTVWTEPDWIREFDEFERMQEEGVVEDARTVFDHAKATGRLLRLEWAAPGWASMENGDVSEPLTVDRAREMADFYGRDIDPILETLSEEDGTMEAPILMIRTTGQWYGVAGNTRLMACRAIGVAPVVWLFNELVSLP